MLGVSVGHAYKIIHRLNEELAEKGYLTFSGRIPRKYLEERCYGLTEGGSRQ
ncbi:MAG: ICEBs1 excisionase [Clostridia bacterium]|nr:ICEBs1 excisionase [Clostridia bacterium]